jgi:hypothetical protein
MRELIRHGAGIGGLPTFLAEEDVAAGALVLIELLRKRPLLPSGEPSGDEEAAPT